MNNIQLVAILNPNKLIAYFGVSYFIFFGYRNWFKSGNPGYLVAYNSAQHNTTIDITTIPYVSKEVNVVTYSPNYVEKLANAKKLMSNSIPLSPKSTLVVTFVPKT